MKITYKLHIYLGLKGFYTQKLEKKIRVNLIITIYYITFITLHNL